MPALPAHRRDGPQATSSSTAASNGDASHARPGRGSGHDGAAPGPDKLSPLTSSARSHSVAPTPSPGRPESRAGAMTGRSQSVVPEKPHGGHGPSAGRRTSLADLAEGAVNATVAKHVAASAGAPAGPTYVELRRQFEALMAEPRESLTPRARQVQSFLNDELARMEESTGGGGGASHAVNGANGANANGHGRPPPDGVTTDRSSRGPGPPPVSGVATPANAEKLDMLRKLRVFVQTAQQGGFTLADLYARRDEFAGQLRKKAAADAEREARENRRKSEADSKRDTATAAETAAAAKAAGAQAARDGARAGRRAKKFWKVAKDRVLQTLGKIAITDSFRMKLKHVEASAARERVNKAVLAGSGVLDARHEVHAKLEVTLDANRTKEARRMRAAKQAADDAARLKLVGASATDAALQTEMYLLGREAGAAPPPPDVPSPPPVAPAPVPPRRADKHALPAFHSGAGASEATGTSKIAQLRAQAKFLEALLAKQVMDNLTAVNSGGNIVMQSAAQGPRLERHLSHAPGTTAISEGAARAVVKAARGFGSTTVVGR